MYRVYTNGQVQSPHEWKVLRIAIELLEQPSAYESITSTTVPQHHVYTPTGKFISDLLWWTQVDSDEVE
jgi:hypothetical protein